MVWLSASAHYYAIMLINLHWNSMLAQSVQRTACLLQAPCWVAIMDIMAGMGTNMADMALAGMASTSTNTTSTSTKVMVMVTTLVVTTKSTSTNDEHAHFAHAFACP